MLLMVEKGIREGITHSIHRYAEANNKYMKDYDKNIKSSYLMYLDAKNLYGWEMFENCLWMVLNGEKYAKMQLIFYKKTMMQTVIKDVLVDVEYSENLHDFHNHLPFLLGKMEINKCEKLV